MGSTYFGSNKVQINNRDALTGLKISDYLKMNTYIFNTTIAVPSSYPAKFTMKEVSTKEATEIIEGDFTSAIGHLGSADAIQAVTGVNPSVNRIQAALNAGDRALCFKLNGRLPEGAIIDADACAAIGFKFILMERTE
jgi:hypothetical protein